MTHLAAAPQPHRVRRLLTRRSGGETGARLKLAGAAAQRDSRASPGPMIGASLPGMRRMAQGPPSERGVHRGRNDRAPPPDQARRAARRAGVGRRRQDEDRYYALFSALRP
jgi:hypothetical protein